MKLPSFETELIDRVLPINHQDRYYNLIRSLCIKSSVEYYVGRKGKLKENLKELIFPLYK